MRENAFCLAFFLFLWIPSLYAQPASTSPIQIGEQLTLKSKVLGETRLLNVYLPLGYQDSTKAYPVIYLLDGSLTEDFIHVSGLVQFASFSWINLIPESIVVGISNVDRKRDFTFPSTIEQDKIDFPTTGGSAAFIQFLEEEVKPLVEQTFRVSPQTTLIGQSLGGLLATEILLKKPGMFETYVIVSPSLWWDRESLLELEIPQMAKSRTIHVAVGKEGAVMQRDAKKLFKMLNKEHQKDASISFEFLKAQDHGDALHLAVYGAFEQFAR